MPITDQEREERITYKIIVDCYNELEVAMGWYYYLQDNLNFPFDARISGSSQYNTLPENETVTVVSMADEEDCENSMWVTIKTRDGEIIMPLEQIEPINSSGKTSEAVNDWLYWLDQDYQF
ncbi:MAG: calcium-binding protein [Verrucomicrobiota bacterium]